MSDRDHDPPAKRAATPSGRDAPGTAPGAAGASVEPGASAAPSPYLQRVSAEEMASWVRLEHITQETAKRLIKAAKHDFARFVRDDRGAEPLLENASAGAAAGNEATEGGAPDRDRRPSANGPSKPPKSGAK
jgi:hypothetical protein